MSFPPKVKEDALVACRRRCVLCGKFCGLKIELHHIKPHGQGGEDTFDNCIPLCFDHHAEVGQAYNPLHPKGTKYTEPELRRTRDEFYKHIAEGNSTGSISKSLSVFYEKCIDILAVLYKGAAVKNELGVIVGYNPKLLSYDFLKERFFHEGIDESQFNELLRALEQMHCISTNLSKNPDQSLSGSVKLEQEGAALYESEIRR